MRVSELYFGDLPEQQGCEQSGYRPLLLIVNFEKLPIALIIPLATTEKVVKYEYVVPIEPDSCNNLVKRSYAMIFQLRTVDKSRLKRKIGIVSNDVMSKIKIELKKMLQL